MLTRRSQNPKHRFLQSMPDLVTANVEKLKTFKTKIQVSWCRCNFLVCS